MDEQEKEVHLEHCNQGEYVGSCKYGDEGCPALVGTGEMTKEQMKTRINLLSDEMDANEEENRAMQAEIDSLYERIDAMK